MASRYLTGPLGVLTLVRDLPGGQNRFLDVRPLRSRRVCMSACAALIAVAATRGMLGCAVGPHYRTPHAPADAGYAPAALPEASASAEVHGGETQHFVAGRDIAFEWWELFQSASARCSSSKRHSRPIRRSPRRRPPWPKHRSWSTRSKAFFIRRCAAEFQPERHKVSGNTNASSTIGVQGNGTDLLPGLEDPYHEPHNVPSYYTFYTAEVNVGFVPDVLGLNRRQVESLAAQKDAAALRA